MEDAELKHLEFVQNVITRMNTNSFQIKGWAVTLVSACLALSVSTKNHIFVFVGVFPTAIFWFLDAFYLMQERRFVGLYNELAGVKEKPEDPELKDLLPFEMNPTRYTKKYGDEYGYWNVFGSTTIYNLYFSVITMLVVLFIFLCLFVRS